MKKTLVLKFGGASVAKVENFLAIADIIVKRSFFFPKIVVVVSAMGNTTNQLMQLAQKIHPNPPKREQDMLISVGERISIALLAMALELKGKKAISFTGSQSGIITCNNHSEAKIVDVQPHRIKKHLDLLQIVIVAGFQGVSKEKEITTLGRGGSDTSAVALAIALDAEKVEFYKDVEGIYDKDPKLYKEAKLYKKISYEKALFIAESGSKILHPRCISLAKKNGCALQILSYLSAQNDVCIENLGTTIDKKEEKICKTHYEQTQSAM